MSSRPDPPFDFGTRLGLAFIVEAACLSALAVISTLLYIGYTAVQINRRGWSSRKWSSGTYMHYYFLALMIFELIQAAGGMMNAKWVMQAAVTLGPYCTAQGVVKQLGDTGVALISLAIALHTFGVLIFRWKSSHIHALSAIGLICLFITLMIGITCAIHKGDTFYGDTKYWCWITANYNRERIGTQYLWLWIAAFVDTILYVFLALVVKGFVIIEGSKVRIATGEDRVRQSSTSRSGSGKDVTSTVAISLLFYPAVYIITVLPIAVVRWIPFSNPDAYVPFGATAFAGVLFGLSGLFNVILFAFTRPHLLPSRDLGVPMLLESPTTSSSGPRTKGHFRDSVTDEVIDWVASPGRTSCSPQGPKSLSIIV
jgi:hypothetical protein